MAQASKQNMTKPAEKSDWEGRYLESHRIETFKSTISLSTEIVKYLTLLNGGAVAGMLTTLDKLTKILSVGTIRISVGLFVLGLVLNGLAVLGLYFSQTVAYRDSVFKPDRKSQREILIGAAMFQIFSLAAFCFGAMVAVFGL